MYSEPNSFFLVSKQDLSRRNKNPKVIPTVTFHFVQVIPIFRSRYSYRNGAFYTGIQ